MLSSDYQAPVLSPAQMADFLMNRMRASEEIQREYRRRNLALFRRIHGEQYAKSVELEMIAIRSKQKRRRKR